MFLFGGEKHCFERAGRMPKLGFSVKQDAKQKSLSGERLGQVMGAGLRATAKAVEKPPDPTVCSWQRAVW